MDMATAAAGVGTDKIDPGYKKVPTYCYQCVAGPDLLTVKVVDGVATEVEPNLCAAAIHPGGGKVCVKAFGLVQKTYNPNRVLTPMKRSNPVKGRDQDPGFVPISWDEAMSLIADRLNAVRDTGLLDESGYPRVAASFGGGGTPQSYMGTFPAFLAAWGPMDMGFGSGQGVKCYHSEHLYGEFWHRAFIVAPDTPLCNYLISCGSNIEASGGVVGIWRHAKARVRGMKRVQVEPHLSVTGACSAQWVPIKPKTDAAFLYALIHVLLHEVARERLDLPFLASTTASPYLVGPNGYYLRDRVSRKPLIWDLASASAREHDEPGLQEALEGWHEVDAIEIGADDEVLAQGRLRGATSFTRLVEHMRPYTPEWAAVICDVPAADMRRIANEYIDHACVGQTIEIDGKTMPYRPVAVTLGKTVNNGWGGFECCWARTLLATLVGGLEVPGGTLGTTVRLNRPLSERLQSVKAGPDGFMHYPLNPTDKAHWSPSPNIRNAYRTMVPLAGDGPWSQALGPTHFSWMFLDETPKGLPRVTLPDIWFVYRTNPAISFWDTEAVTEKMGRFPFVVAFAYTHDETNHFADVLLPDATDLESLQLIRIGATKYVEQFWDHQGFALRQPVVASRGESRDFTDVATELAMRTGLTEKYNAAINKGAAGVPLKSGHADFSLAVQASHTRDEIWDAVCRAASAELTGGEHAHGLEWWKTQGLATRPLSAHRLVSIADPEGAWPAFRVALPGAIAARGYRTGTPAARAWHELVGQAAAGVSGAAHLERLSRDVGRHHRPDRRAAPGLSVLATHRAQHAIRLGRKCRHADDQGGCRQRDRSSRRDHQHPGCSAAGHRRRRPDRNRHAQANGTWTCGGASRHSTRHLVADRPVRPLGNPAGPRLRRAQSQYARVDVCRADRCHRLGRRHRPG
ncbi:MAG: molybdopterin-dependent oxidoreductase [Burkholderiaceae bacterium]